MSILTMIATHLWMFHRLGGTRLNHRIQDKGVEFDDADDSEELEEEGTHRSPHKRPKMHRATNRSRRQDITVWGSYRELAPPVLPVNASVPGFENEVLKSRRKFKCNHDSLGGHDDDEEEEQSAAEESTTDGEDVVQVEHEREPDDASESGRALPDGHSAGTDHTDHMSGFPSLRTLDALRSSLPPSFSSLYSASSLLFGSTTRPAARLRRTPEREDEVSVVRQSSLALQSNGVEHQSITTTMAAKSHVWISLWFLITAPIIFWDAGYCFMRPRSMVGGDLHWIWEPYSIYQEVDYIYGVEVFKRGDGFTNAQSFMNIVETLLNLYYLYLQHLIGSPSAPLVGFATAVMTLSKTVLYWVQEYYCGGCTTGHNDWWTLFWFWIIPNGFWLLFPTLIIRTLANELSQSLHLANRSGSRKKE